MFQVWLTSQVFKVEGILDINMIQVLHFKKEKVQILRSSEAKWQAQGPAARAVVTRSWPPGELSFLSYQIRIQ